MRIPIVTLAAAIAASSMGSTAIVQEPDRAHGQSLGQVASMPRAVRGANDAVSSAPIVVDGAVVAVGGGLSAELVAHALGS